MERNKIINMLLVAGNAVNAVLILLFAQWYLAVVPIISSVALAFKIKSAHIGMDILGFNHLWWIAVQHDDGQELGLPAPDEIQRGDWEPEEVKNYDGELAWIYFIHDKFDRAWYLWLNPAIPDVKHSPIKKCINTGFEFHNVGQMRSYFMDQIRQTGSIEGAFNRVKEVRKRLGLTDRTGTRIKTKRIVAQQPIVAAGDISDYEGGEYGDI